MITKYHPARCKGFFPVSYGHRLYYELIGNPRGKPCVFFHGGPGDGFDDHDKRFFDFKKYQVLFFDQRGAGRSKPAAETRANTTSLLVQDTLALMDHVTFKKALFFGGSWGSTLALLTALQDPQRCSGLIVRSIYLANQEANRYHLQGEWRTHFPEVWERLIAQVPKRFKKNPAKYFHNAMRTGPLSRRKKYCFEWSRFQLSLIKPLATAQVIEKMVRAGPYFALALLETHFVMHACFLPENYILKQAKRLSEIPTWIFHGRWDFACPPLHAYQLHQRIAGSKLSFSDSGHSSSNPQMEGALIKALREF